MTTSAFVVQVAVPELSGTLAQSTALACVAKLTIPEGAAPFTEAVIVNG